MYVIKRNSPEMNARTYWNGQRWVTGLDHALIFPSLAALPASVDGEDRVESEDSRIPYYGLQASSVVLELDDQSFVFGDPTHTAAVDLQIIRNDRRVRKGRRRTDMEVEIEGDADCDLKQRIAAALAKMIPTVKMEDWHIRAVRVTVGNWRAYGFRSEQLPPGPADPDDLPTSPGFRRGRPLPAESVSGTPRHEKVDKWLSAQTDITGPPQMTIEDQEEYALTTGTRPFYSSDRAKVANGEIKVTDWK